MNNNIPKLSIDIRSEADDLAVIDISGEIGWASYDGEDINWNTKEAINKKLKEIEKIGSRKIQVNISSLGGFVDDGFAIHDALAQHPAEIETRVTGMTASAATVIAQAGDKRLMSQNALYLIHHSWGFTMGNINDMMASAGDLEAIDKRMLELYARRSKKDKDKLAELMSANDGAGKWIDADEAKEYGLIDEVFEPMRAAASVNAGQFRSMGIPVPNHEAVTVESSKGKSDRDDLSEPPTLEQLKAFESFVSKAIKSMETNDGSDETDSIEESQGIPTEGIALHKAREREIEIITKSI